MPLTPGSRLGVFDVGHPIGQGGMGVVCRARDTELGRDVALKVLSDVTGATPARVARFEREARLLAALNHPNIATIYGVARLPGDPSGTADSTERAIVMELVEGESLDDRIRRGRVPVPDAVRLAAQIADALEAAHEKGIIHRDLKPANIRVTPDGVVKVLDFGLAKLVSADEPEPGHDPTMTAPTEHGAVLGTARYMSPEQARGQALDRRTDIWSFGCVLYELLTGAPAFPGPTASDALAAVLSREPDWSVLPDDTPAGLRRLLRRSIEKDPRRRLRDIGDARLDLTTSEEPDVARPGPDTTRPTSGFRRLPWAVGLALGVAAVGAGFGLARWLGTPEPGAADPIRLTALMPPGISLTRGPGTGLPLALSPDGRTLVVAGSDVRGPRLYRRDRDSLAATPLDGTEGASTPFFSPDGEWIGFFADRRLRRIPASGGPVIDITDAANFPSGATWSPGGQIVFAMGLASPLFVVPAEGGAAVPLPTDGRGGRAFPDFLPDGRTVLFSRGNRIVAIDIGSGQETEVIEGTMPRYVTGGTLVFTRGNTLLATPFDAATLKAGTAVPVLEGIALQRTGVNAPPYVAVARSGGLAYAPEASGHALVVRLPDGASRVLTEAPLLQNPRFSPDGRRIVAAVSRRPEESADLWLYDITGTTPPTRLTTSGGRSPVWTPDGAAITYSLPGPPERRGVYTMAWDRPGSETQVQPVAGFHWLVGWTRAPRTLAYGLMEPPSPDGQTLSAIATIVEGQSRTILGPGNVWGGRLSRSGRWLAYYTLDSGYFEVYATPYPGAGTRHLIAEGTDPVWAPDDSEIYYRSGNRLMAARVEIEVGVRVLSRRVVVEPFAPPLYDDYDVHPNGLTLALVQPSGDATGREVAWVMGTRLPQVR